MPVEKFDEVVEVGHQPWPAGPAGQPVEQTVLPAEASDQARQVGGDPVGQCPVERQQVRDLLRERFLPAGTQPVREECVDQRAVQLDLRAVPNLARVVGHVSMVIDTGGRWLRLSSATSHRRDVPVGPGSVFPGPPGQLSQASLRMTWSRACSRWWRIADSAAAGSWSLMALAIASCSAMDSSISAGVYMAAMGRLK